jgi:hypothetical protein
MPMKKRACSEAPQHIHVREGGGKRKGQRKEKEGRKGVSLRNPFLIMGSHIYLKYCI